MPRKHHSPPVRPAAAFLEALESRMLLSSVTLYPAGAPSEFPPSSAYLKDPTLGQAGANVVGFSLASDIGLDVDTTAPTAGMSNPVVTQAPDADPATSEIHVTSLSGTLQVILRDGTSGSGISSTSIIPGDFTVSRNNIMLVAGTDYTAAVTSGSDASGPYYRVNFTRIGSATTWTGHVQINVPGGEVTDLSGNKMPAYNFNLFIYGAVNNRAIFYNNSSFDGNSTAINSADDAAIATDKSALLPGSTATFANYTSYSKGINGIMVDMAGLTGTITASDFTFKVGNASDTSTWTTAPTPTSITVRAGAGVNGSDRVEIT